MISIVLVAIILGAFTWLSLGIREREGEMPSPRS